MNTNDIKRCIDKIVECDPDVLVFSGGEPLIRADFLDILEYASQVYKGKITLSTNALLINESNVKQLVQYLEYIDVSIDGVNEESCAQFRGKGVFEKVINAINLLHTCNFFNISLSMVFSDKNKHLRNTFLELNDKLKTQPLMRAFEAVGRGLVNVSEFMTENYPQEIYYDIPQESLDDARGNSKCISCGAGKKEFMIDPEGFIYPCGNLNSNKYRMGNLKELESFTEYLQSSEFMASEGYKQLYSMQPYNFYMCKDCEVNFFCWTCLSSIELKSSNIEIFKNECVAKRKILNKVIWDKTLD